MLRISVIILLTFQVTKALADFNPKVGDTAFYEVESYAPSVKKVEIKRDFIENRVKYFQINVYRGTVVPGKRPSAVVYQTEAELRKSYISNLKEFCDDEAGLIESVETEYGSFEGCKLERPNEAVWYGANIPFGVIKRIYRAEGGIAAKESLVDFY